jgi:hypothetical protein
MKVKIVFVFCSLFFGLVTLGLAQTPCDYQKWQIDDTTFSITVGGAVQNYPDTDTSWAEIEIDWGMIGDTISVRNALMKTDVLPDGLSRISVKYNDTVYTITQRLVKLIWLKTDTWNWIDVASIPNWGTPSVDSNIIKWSNVFPAVDYRIRKCKAKVEHGIFFKSGFLDSAVTLYNERSDSLDIALGNVMEYTLSANIDSADIGIGNVNKRVLKRIGKYVFGLAKAYIHFPGSDTLDFDIVNHRWIKQNEKIYCIEYIKMGRLKQIHDIYPDATIWHNDSPHVISGTTNIDDSYLDGTNYPDYNYGANGALLAYEGAAGRYSIIRAKNVASELGVGATITSCVLSLYAYLVGGCTVVKAYRVLKPWVEGTQTSGDNEPGVTWNDWDNDAYEWATPGAGNTGDGSDNSGDGIGLDRWVTEEDEENCSIDETWCNWTIGNTLAQGWYDGTINEEGVLVVCEANKKFVIFRATEYGSDIPYFTFTYTVSGGARRAIELRGD